MIELGCNTGIADVGMNRIGEIDRCRITRQLDDIAVRRVDIDLVVKQVDLDVLEKLQRVTGGLLHLENTGEPVARTCMRADHAGIVRRLVQPVCCYAAFREYVHFLGANLHLHRYAMRAVQHRVQ